MKKIKNKKIIENVENEKIEEIIENKEDIKDEFEESKDVEENCDVENDEIDDEGDAKEEIKADKNPVKKIVNEIVSKVKCKKKYVIASASCVAIIGIVVCILLTNNIKNERLKIEEQNNKNKNVVKEMTYEEYKKKSTEFYYERMLVKMGKDYEPCVTMGEEKIFEKKKTKQRVVFYVEKNKDSKSMGRAYLRKYVKKLNKKAEYIETVKYEEFEYDIYEGKDKKGKNIKYAISANEETKILVTYTYGKDGQDSDLKLILKSIRI